MSNQTLHYEREENPSMVVPAIKTSGSRPGMRVTATVLSLVMGLAVGVFAHYILYRLSLPSKPFIYAAF